MLESVWRMIRRIMKNSRRTLKIMGGAVIAAAVAVTAGLWYCKEKEIEPSAIPELIETQDEETDGNLRLYFMDVGQGSAALAKLNGKSMLIDGGGPETAASLLDYLKDSHVEQLDYILVTSYDEDHLAGVVEVLKTYPVSSILAPASAGEGGLYEEYEQLVEEKKIEVRHPQFGETYTFANTFLNIAGPVEYGHADREDDSLCVRLHYGDTNFLFGGDTRMQGEAEIAQAALETPEVSLESDVYVINAHGASDASTEEFLKMVRPEYAVLSCGGENGTDEPSEEVMERLEAKKIKLFRTDVQGTIEAVSDGSVLIWNSKPCNDYAGQE